LKDDRRFPPEWSWQRRIWTAWPSHEAYWEGRIDLARCEVAAFFEAMVAGGEEDIVAWVDPVVVETIPSDLRESRITWLVEPLGDIWIRDTGPLFTRVGNEIRAVCFRQNGWGGKYVMPGDERVGKRISEEAGYRREDYNLVVEGGALELDAKGTLLTTKVCVLNSNRNPGLKAEEAEEIFRQSLGVGKTIWLEGGLLNDHTDGHIDNIARFVGPGKVAVMEPFGEHDPNRGQYEAIIRKLENETDLDGNRLSLHGVPSPGRIEGHDGEIVPASHLNFLIRNRQVIVPVYGARSTDDALSAIQAIFPDREVVGLSAKAILSGGGAFHCMTQQEPVRI